ncbi:MAG: phosphatase PAP2 family protein [Myxococcota bacterium]
MSRLRAIAFFGLVFVGLSVGALVSPEPFLFDGAGLGGLRAIRTETLNAFVLLLSETGGSKVMMPAGVLLFIFALRKNRRAGVFVAVTLLGSFGLNQLLKALIARPRPDLAQAVYDAQHASFPSGHSQASMTFVLVCLVLAGERRPGVISAALLFPVVIGLTRVYLGVHYPTDVLAGWCLAVCVVGLSARVYAQRRTA